MPSGAQDMNDYYRLASSTDFDHTRVADTLDVPSIIFHTLSGVPKYLKRNQLNPAAKAWAYFVSARLLPSTHFSEIDIDRLKFVYEIMTGLWIDVGRIIHSSI